MAEALQIVDLDYAGEASSYMLLRPVAKADTFEKGAIAIQETKKEYHYPRLEISNWIQRDSPTPVSQGSIVIDAVKVILGTFQIYMEFNPQDFAMHWYSGQLQKEILDRTLPDTVQSYLVRHLFDRNNLAVDEMVWQSRLVNDPLNPAYSNPLSAGYTNPDDANYFYFDGLITQLVNDANTIKLSGYTASAFTSASILSTLETAYLSVPIGQLFKYGPMGVKFLMSLRTRQVLEEAYNITTTFKGENFYRPGVQLYKGYDMVSIAGFPDNTLIVCMANLDVSSSNTQIAVNSTGDQQQVKLAQLQANSDMFFVKAKLKMATTWSFTDQAVLLTTITA
jgi:hypothetical protein